MEARRITAPQKVLLWLLLIFVIWRVLYVPAVAEAILTFVLAGDVPGTSIVLSPDTVIRGAGISLIALGMLFVAKLVISRLARRERRPKAPSPHHVYTSNQAGQVIKIPAAPAYRPPRITEGLPEAIRSLLGWIQYRLIVDFYTIKSDLRKLLFWITAVVQAAWQWLKPQLWRFDAWLGMQYTARVKALQRKLGSE